MTSAPTATRASSSRGAARRPTTRRPASATAASTACGSTTCRPGPRTGPATGTSTTPISTATTRPTTASRSRGSTAATAGRSAAPRGDLGKVVRYVGLDLLAASSPLYPPYYTADRDPGDVDLDVNTLEGWAGTDASRSFIKFPLFLQEERELPTGFDLSTDSQDLPFAGDLKRCFEGEFPLDPDTAPSSCYPAVRPAAGREPVPGGGQAHQSVPRGRRRLRGRAAQLRDEGRLPDPARLRRRQLAGRHAERRLQLRLAGHHRRRVRPHDHDDPRVRASLVA